MFRTKYNCDNSSVVSNNGSPFIDTYGFTTDDYGNTIVGVTGQSNLFDIIQSNSDSGNISLIVDRATRGDLSYLNAVNSAYFDARDLPTSYREMTEYINHCNNTFNELPAHIKEAFNNSSSEFWSTFGSDSWNRRVGFNSEDSSSNDGGDFNEQE
ncbi:minor capsid protein [Capybara microvirus Cap3_SP_546]|nr:minor capsid protein [Capybara microvirus Cap3_SP_546]